MRDLVFEIEVEKSKAEDRLRELQRAMDTTVEDAKKLGGATDDLTKRYDTLQKSADRAKGKIKEYDDQIKAAKRSTDQKSESIRTLGQRAEQAAGGTGNRGVAMLSNAVMRYVSAGVALAAIKSTADWADRLQDLSGMSGIAAASLAKMEKIARGNGASLEDIGRIAVTLTDRIAGGDRSVVRGFDKLGLSVRDFQKLNPEQQLIGVGKALGQMQDHQSQLNAASDLFGGRVGPRVVGALIEISKGLNDVNGPTNEQIRKVAEVTDKWDAMTTTLKGDLLAVLSDVAAWSDSWVGRSNALVGGLGAVAEAQNYLNQAWFAGYGFMVKLDEALERYGMRLKVGKLPIPGAPTQFDPGTPSIPEGLAIDPRAELKQIEILREAIQMQERKAQAAEAAAERIAKAAEKELQAQLRVLDAASKLASVYGNPNGAAEMFGAPNTAQNFAWQSGTAGFRPWEYNPWQYGSGTQMLANGMAWNMGPPTSTAGGRGFAMNQWQQRWMQSNFSRENFAGTMIGYGDAVADIAENGDPIWNATDRMGRGSRMGHGALAGAKTGMKYGGPWGAAGGALIGAIVGAVRNPAFEDVFHRVAKNYGTDISEERARGIADTAKNMFGGNRQAAEIYSLSSIMGEGGGVTKNNVDALMARFRDSFAMQSDGKFSKDQLSKVLDENFGVFADYFHNLGDLADERLTEIVKMQREVGVESAAIGEYVSAQVESSVAGLEQFLSVSTVRSQEAASGMVAATVLLFDELKKGPDGVRGALERMAPLVVELEARLNEAGFAGNDAFTKILEIAQAVQVEGVAPAIEAVDGLTATLVGMSNAAMMNEDVFRGLARGIADEINVARDAMIAAGKDGDAALSLNQKSLQTIWELQQRYNYTLDETTQTLLDQATAQGLVGEAFMDANERMASTMGEVRDILKDMRNAMLGVGDAAEDAAEQTRDAWRDMKPPSWWGDVPPDVSGEYAARGGYVTARGIRYLAQGGVLYPHFMARGSDTVPAMLTPGEGVLSRRGMAALGRLNRGESASGGNTFHITVHANDAQGGRDAADALVDQLRRRGVRLEAA